MKKLIFLLLFAVVPICSQTIYSDSLANGADTVFIQKFKYAHELIYIGADNYGSGSVGLTVNIGKFIKNPAGAIVDTGWYRPVLRDSVWDAVSTWTVPAGEEIEVTVVKFRPSVVKIELTTDATTDSCRVNIEGIETSK